MLVPVLLLLLVIVPLVLLPVVVPVVVAAAAAAAVARLGCFRRGWAYLLLTGLESCRRESKSRQTSGLCTGSCPQKARETRGQRWRRKIKLVTLFDLCVSSLRRGHANLLCIVPILMDDLRRGSETE